MLSAFLVLVSLCRTRHPSTCSRTRRVIVDEHACCTPTTVWAHGLVPSHSDPSAGGASPVEDYDYDGNYDYDANPKTGSSTNSTRYAFFFPIRGWHCSAQIQLFPAPSGRVRLVCSRSQLNARTTTNAPASMRPRATSKDDGLKETASMRR